MVVAVAVGRLVLEVPLLVGIWGGNRMEEYRVGTDGAAKLAWREAIPPIGLRIPRALAEDRFPGGGAVRNCGMVSCKSPLERRILRPSPLASI